MDECRRQFRKGSYLSPLMRCRFLDGELAGVTSRAEPPIVRRMCSSTAFMSSPPLELSLSLVTAEVCLEDPLLTYS